MFEGNNEAKLKHSKDKGLYPLLKAIQRKLNKSIVGQIDPDYEILFVGLDGQSISEELDSDIKKVTNFATLNEIRKKYNMDDLEGGDTPLNSIFLQGKMMADQKKQQEDQAAQSKKDQDEFNVNPFDEGGDEEDNQDGQDNQDNQDEEDGGAPKLPNMSDLKKAILSNFKK
jgi:hypothetical protein